MTTSNQFLLALEAYQEIQAELHQEQSTRSQTPVSTPTQTPAAAFPGGSILLGMAEDGMPVLLNLYDPAPGPLLVAGDGGSGKTALLQSMARATHLEDTGDIQFGVLTPFPEEWTSLESLPECLGVWPAYHPSAQAFLSQLVGWAEALSKTRQAVLLLFDGFDLMTDSSYQTRQDLRWLLTYGPERHIWPVLTVNPARLVHQQHWLAYFHTRLLGHVKNSQNARILLDEPKFDLSNLLQGTQFGLFQPSGWLKFWLPPLD